MTEPLDFPLSRMTRVFVGSERMATQVAAARNFIVLTEPETILIFPEVGSVAAAQYDDGWAAIYSPDDTDRAAVIGSALPKRRDAIRVMLRHFLGLLDSGGNG